MQVLPFLTSSQSCRYSVFMFPPSLVPRPLSENESEVEKSVSRSPLEGLVHLTQAGVGIWHVSCLGVAREPDALYL
jgi:hypothetical protein